MALQSINPKNGELIAEFTAWNDEALDQAMAQTADAVPIWSNTPISERCHRISRAADALRLRREELARLITLEMGKLYREALAEIDKCASVCDYYATNGEAQLADDIVDSDASRSFVTYQSLGTVLAVMPWNFPFWQVFRAAAPALVAGNTMLLKHASNVPQCAQAIEDIFTEAGLPSGTFINLKISASQVEQILRDPRIHAATLTGSEPAGMSVGKIAGEELKKVVLELGGSDPFIVLNDADIELAVQNAVASRFLNCGQSCIAAKRFIVVEEIANTFITAFVNAVNQLVSGDPMDAATTIAPMARVDLRDELHQQVADSVNQGAVLLTGGQPLEGNGAYYAPTIIDHVKPGQRAYSEELFGPVAIVIRVNSDKEAINVANSSPFGLGGSVWTTDPTKGERVARQLQCGCAFVNGMVKSDPRLPFGGVKRSGHGRELSFLGIKEFTNPKTIWIR